MSVCAITQHGALTNLVNAELKPIGHRHGCVKKGKMAIVTIDADPQA
jgi:hypothetical protein